MTSFNALIRQSLAENGELYRSTKIQPDHKGNGVSEQSYVAVQVGNEYWVIREDIVTSVHFWNCDREAVETTIAFTAHASWENPGLAIAHVDRLEALSNPPAYRRLALAA